MVLPPDETQMKRMLLNTFNDRKSHVSLQVCVERTVGCCWASNVEVVCLEDWR